MIKIPKHRCEIGVINTDHLNTDYIEHICIVCNKQSHDTIIIINNKNSYVKMFQGTYGSFYKPKKKPPINFSQNEFN